MADDLRFGSRQSAAGHALHGDHHFRHAGCAPTEGQCLRAGLIGYATASYGVGQILGPLFAAPLAQRTGSFTVALWVAAAVLAAGALLFAMVWWRAARDEAAQKP